MSRVDVAGRYRRGEGVEGRRQTRMGVVCAVASLPGKKSQYLRMRGLG